VTGKSLRERHDAMIAIEDARRTIALAKVRCLSFDALLERLRCVLTDSTPSEVVYAVIETERDAEQDHKLAQVVVDLAKTADQAPRKEKEWLDRQIGRLLSALPKVVARPIAREFLTHSRKIRREIGLKRLALEVADEETTRLLLARFEQTNDIDFLKAILRHPLLLDLINPSTLIAQFDEDYWKMRVVEATLRSNEAAGIALAHSHPLPFVWAVGRTENPRFVPIVSDCLRRANDKATLIGIVAWAFGKLQAAAQLQALEPLLDQLAAENTIDWDSESRPGHAHRAPDG
jgi:hypothetical protein